MLLLARVLAAAGLAMLVAASFMQWGVTAGVAAAGATLLLMAWYAWWVSSRHE